MKIYPTNDIVYGRKTYEEIVLEYAEIIYNEFYLDRRLDWASIKELVDIAEEKYGKIHKC